MATRLLHPKARTLILENMAKLKEAVTKARESRRMWHRLLYIESEATKKISEIDDFIKSCDKDFISYEQLLASHVWEKTRHEPCTLDMSCDTKRVIFGKKLMGTVILFQDAFHLVTGPYSSEEACLIFLKKFKKQRSEVEFLVFRKDTPETEGQYERVRIAEETRNEVWRRDQGCCAKCKSVRNLEFDHIVPVSKGGSNSARNLQLLCETCNRRKSNSIG